MKRRFRVKFSKLVIFLAIATTVVILSILSVVAINGTNQIIDDYSMDSNTTAVAIASNQSDYYLQKVKTSMNSLLSNSDFINYVAEYGNLSKYVDKLNYNEHIYDQLNLNSSLGMIDYITIYYGAEKWSTGLFEPDYITLNEFIDKTGYLAKHDSDIHLEYLQISLVSAMTIRQNRNELCYISEIYKQNDLVGLLIFGINLESIQSLLDTDDYYLLYNDDIVLQSINSQQNLSILDSIHITEDGFTQSTDASAYIQPLSDASLRIALIRTRQYQSSIRRFVLLTILLAVVCGICGCVLFSLPIAKRISSAISNLTTAIQSWDGKTGRSYHQDVTEVRRIKKLIIMTMLFSVLVSTGIFVTIYISSESKIVYSEITSAREKSFEIGSAALETMLAEQFDLCEEISINTFVQDGLQGISDMDALSLSIDEIMVARGQKAYVQIYNTDDQMIFSTQQNDTTNIFKNGHDIGYMQSGNRYFGWGYDEFSNRNFYIGYKIHSFSNNNLSNYMNHIGWAAIILTEYDITACYSDLLYKYSIDVYIINDGDVILLSQDRNKIGQTLQSDITENMVVLQIKDTPFRYVASYDWSMIQNDYYKVASNLVFIAVGIYLFLELILLITVERPIVAIIRLSDEIRSYNGLDNIETLFLDRSRVAEIDELGNAFNEMKEKIENLMDNLMIAQIKERELYERQRSAEFYSLQVQIRPHLISNILESIRTMINDGRKRDADATIRALDQLLRYSLSRDEMTVPLVEEIRNLQSFADIMSRRNQNRIKALFKVDEAVKDFRVPRLLLQPLVENAFKHGFVRTSQSGTIYISCFQENSFVKIIITDDGDGKDRSDFEKGIEGGIGITNVKKRMQICFGENAKFLFRSSKTKGTTIEIWLPNK